jgi:hypothetical protein
MDAFRPCYLTKTMVDAHIPPLDIYDYESEIYMSSRKLCAPISITAYSLLNSLSSDTTKEAINWFSHETLCNILRQYYQSCIKRAYHVDDQDEFIHKHDNIALYDIYTLQQNVFECLQNYRQLYSFNLYKKIKCLMQGVLVHNNQDWLCKNDVIRLAHVHGIFASHLECLKLVVAQIIDVQKSTIAEILTRRFDNHNHINMTILDVCW